MIGMMPVVPRSFMATDFSTYPVGDGLQQHGWTRGGADTGNGSNFSNATYTITADGNAIGGRCPVMDQSVTEYRYASWNIVGSIDNFEFLALIKLIDHPDTTGGGGITWVGGNEGSADGYDWVFDDDSASGGNDQAHISRFDNGFYVHSVATQGITLNTTNKFWMRGRRQGTTLSIKVWRNDASEPSSWQSGINQIHQGTRLFGIQTVRDRRFQVEWLALAKGDKTAPNPAG